MADEIEQLRHQLRFLARQQASDFEFLALGLKETGHHVRVSLERLGRETEERFNQLEGRARLSEQRLGVMLELVDASLGTTQHDRHLLEDLTRRVEALERRGPAA